MDVAASPKSKKKDGFEPYEIENAASDIMRAEEHKQNPKLMEHVHKHMLKKAKAMKKGISSIQDLKDHYQAMSDEKAEE